MTTPLRSIDWTLLHTFLAVFDQGSLIAAMPATGLSQPTLGRHIDQLEAQLGVSLFERAGRGLQPTQAARTIEPSVRNMQTAADELMMSLKNAASQFEGTVRISCTRDVAAYCMPKLLPEIQAAQPHIQIELIASAEQSNLLRREADIALRLVRPTQTGLITKKLGDLPFGVYAHTRYLAVHGTPTVPSDLLNHTLIGFDRFDNIIKGFAQQGFVITPSQFSLRTDDTVTYWEALRSGYGVGFLAAHIAAQDAQVIRILPQMPLPSLPVWLTTHRELRGNANIRWVYDFLAKRFMSTVQSLS
jgi:DNA-binding transcriptional LysR family regulator